MTKENISKLCCDSCSKAYHTLDCKKDEMFCFNDKSPKYAQHVKKNVNVSSLIDVNYWSDKCE